MKTKGNNSDVAHYWANQVQDELSNANGSFYYDGCTIYSYGSHFPIASERDDVQYLGNNIILFTTHGYSNTTAKHMNHVHRAIDNQKKIFYVDDVLAVEGQDHLNNFNEYKTRFTDKLKESVRSRKYKAMLFDDALCIARDANQYAQLFNLAIEPIDIEKYNLDEIKETLKQEKIERAKQAKIKAAQLLIDNAEKIAQWKAGERGYYNSLYGLPCMLRINKEDDTIETSQGANVPIKDAKLLLIYIRMYLNDQVEFEHKRVGHYTLNKIANNGDVTIGCHFIKHAELQEISKLLNSPG